MTVTTRIGDTDDSQEKFRRVLTRCTKPSPGRTSQSLTDKGYWAVLKRLIDHVVDFRTQFVRATPQQLQNSSRGAIGKTKRMLPACATCMRFVIEAGVLTIRYKTAKFVIRHIIETLPAPSEGYIGPLLAGYTKCLRQILEYPPHVEHLSKESGTIIVFCLKAVSFLAPDSQPPPGTNRLGTPRLTPEPSGEASAGHSSERHSSSSHVAVDDLVACIRYLTTAPNSPVLDHAPAILLTLTAWLNSSRGVGLAHVDAFVAINAVLSKTCLDSISTTQQAICGLLPVLRLYWPSKLTSLKDEMLTTLVLCRAHIHRMLREAQNDVGDLRVDLENFIQAMHTDYVRRVEREQLQLEDVRLRCASEYPHDETPFSLPVFRLKPGNTRSEYNWTVLFLVVDLANALQSSRSSADRSTDQGGVQATPSKRRRTSNYLQDYLRELASPQLSEKLFALQIITFISQQVRLTSEDVRMVLEKLTSRLSDGHSAISSWAMLGTASCAVQLASSSPELREHWTTVWQLCSRNVTTSSTSRAAAHSMDVILRLGLVDFSAVAETVEAMISSVELRGPVVLSESCCSLWLTMFDVRSSESPHSSLITIEHMLRWLFSKWTPSKWGRFGTTASSMVALTEGPGNFHDRAHSTQRSHHYDAWDIIRMLFMATDRLPPPHLGRPFCSLGPLALAFIRAGQYSQLASYLLLSPREEAFIAQPRFVSGTISNVHHNRSVPADNVILDFCSSEMERTSKQFTDTADERAQSFNTDMIRTISILCVVCCQLSTSINGIPSDRCKELERNTIALVRALASFISRPDCDPLHVDAVLEVVAPSLPKIVSLNSLGSDLFKSLGINPLISFFSEALENCQRQKDSIESMEIDDFDSQTSNRITKCEASDLPREDIVASLSANASRTTLSATLILLASAIDTLHEDEDDPLDHETSYSRIPEAFQRHLVALPASDFLMCKRLIADILASPLLLTNDDVNALLQAVATKLLFSYEHAHSEVAIGFCVELMNGTALAWTDREAQACNVGADIYEWLMKALEQRVASAAVQIKMADLLQKLLQIQPDYTQGPGMRLPSVRTSLFSILQNGGISVKFHVIELLSGIFDYFVLSKHDAVFDDVHANLPSDQNSMEEMALRLLGLARMGAAWHTLLRRSVYHIFEAAGLVKESAGHAARCIQTISSSLNLESSKSVFELFAPQMFYTWMGANQRLEDIPYSIFGYESLAALLEDSQDEAYGQLIMRNNEEEVPVVLEALKVTQKDLAERNFSKAAGYAIAWDQCRGRGSQRDNAAQNNEMALRALLGDNTYKNLLAQQFPCVLAVLISTMEETDLVGKSIHKHPEFQKVEDAMAEMQNFSSSSLLLPADQQPVFQAKHIFEEIKRLCRRTGYDHVNFWTPDCLVYIMRCLLDKIHPALGSLYACSIVRKIRFLVALAGKTAFETYPLQMALSSLRPFLTDAHCAEDTLGIVRYLLQHGKHRLKDQLSFVAGNSISILISLRLFFSSSQDNTTQESQHVAAVQKAQEFDNWFSGFLESYVQDLLSSTSSRSTKASLELFQSMVRAARDVRAAGNAVEGTPESTLLMSLLRDEANEKRLLNGPSQELAYSLLCQEFQLPTSFREDLLGKAELAAQYATQVWKSSQRANNSKQYLLWAARVLGRSYGATGELHENLRKALREKNGVNIRGRKSRTSRMLIVENLADLLQGDDPSKASLAERTLREILSADHEQPAVVEQLEEIKQVLPSALVAGLTMNGAFKIPLLQPISNKGVETTLFPQSSKKLSTWISDLCISLAKSTPKDRVVSALPRCLSEIPSLSEQLFPYILHLALERDVKSGEALKRTVSEAYRKWFEQETDEHVPYLKALLRSVLYIRTQQIPSENNISDRTHWLNIDYLNASKAASRCGMHRAALLLAETHASQPAKTSRRSSVLPQQQSIPLELQLSIYTNLDEPDSFYGAEQEPSLESVLNRLDYEADGFKGLLFHSAKMDSEMRRNKKVSPSDSTGVVRDLAMLNLNSLTHAISSNEDIRDSRDNLNHTLEVAQKLEQWDIRAPHFKKCEAAAVYKAFQGMSMSTDLASVRKNLNHSFLEIIETCIEPNASARTLQSSLRSLAVLNEIDEIMTVSHAEELRGTWREIKWRTIWMKEARMEDIRPILAARETLWSMLSKTPSLQAIIHTDPRQLREREADALINGSDVYRKHHALQELLASATYLADIVPSCREVGYDIENGAKYQVARVLWDQGEKNTSIRMLQQLEAQTKSRKDPTVARTILLTKLGQYTAEARLKKPEEIMKQYMEPAIRELKSNTKTQVAGQAYHAFASFCDQQLQSPELLEDQNRMRLLAERKEADALEYERMASAQRSKSSRDHYRGQARRARKWFNMDMQEAQKLGDSRVAFLRQSLENYLLALQACNDYDNDVFRMFALWLEYSHLSLANHAVSKYIQPVPSSKFVVLMNQLSSRLQDESSDFQQILSSLVLRICKDHPYHGMNHIYAGSYTEKMTKDQTVKSRYEATKNIGRQLKADKTSHEMWERISKANTIYNDLAMFVDTTMFKVGRDYELQRYPISKKLTTSIPSLKVPPITMHIPVQSSAYYKEVPKIHRFKSTMGIANGLSQPKIVTAIADNGQAYKQLYKSGNDDLRQDAIMEQVFEHVSQLLRNHMATRLRNLNIRTYKVVPLTHRSGVIEFVQNTIPLMNFLDGAHQTYYPKDWDHNQCRRKITEISSHTHEERLKVYREVCRNFNPVLRYFFLERFGDPDDWFEKRLAYTRSTAAISILGHVLGLGDRHCHNILLDQQSGDTVHIDLGVAFEAGRVLPVPEVVPFRLTRDIVDAMGYSGVEGVFRRCCEFTLDTLRDERGSIMTILNVLRYDPLYSWSVSPLKAKKMQEEAQKEAEGNNKTEGGGKHGENNGVGRAAVSEDPSGAGDGGEQRFLLEIPMKRKEDEEVQGEAGRALSVVERKLSKGLSSAAAVAELIQQATDERNLAVLYSGWSAWC
ncbi:serine threonine-protein kinase tel1 [Diplodia corticola]|uniref:Serine/threonine-protein kinase Tel1 n=1 Tax=Diplodia corticola TaxID=236234 RepID=A0A1J9QS10_9PEZI|nr:serine threonine-protein kinase tel1 [Diplodia corticola]OJD31209.1 serine threonine-protein kinase tel1 [Diplodia corticola]